MPVNHSIEVLLTKGKGGGLRSQTSPLKNLEDIRQKNKTFGEYYEHLESLQGITSSVGIKDKLGIAGSYAIAIAKMATQFADAGLNVLYDIDYAVSNEKIEFNNKKKIKNYVFNPVQYIADVTYGKWLADISIRRENQANDRARELSGNIIIGNQFGNKR